MEFVEDSAEKNQWSLITLADIAKNDVSTLNNFEIPLYHLHAPIGHILDGAPGKKIIRATGREQQAGSDTLLLSFKKTRLSRRNSNALAFEVD
jgi:hypothetical protein